MFREFLPSVCFVLMVSSAVFGHTPASDVDTWVAEIGSRSARASNLSYADANNHRAKLDVLWPRAASATASVLTVIYIRGTHRGFKREEFIRIYATIREFLQKHGIAK